MSNTLSMSTMPLGQQYSYVQNSMYILYPHTTLVKIMWFKSIQYATVTVTSYQQPLLLLLYSAVGA